MTPAISIATAMLADIKRRVVIADHDSPACPEAPAGTFCTGQMHYRGEQVGLWAEVIGRCPVVVRSEVKARIKAERERLAGAIARSHRTPGFGFQGYDPKAHPDAGEALREAEAFAASRPPRCGLVLSGPFGLGKTRLLLGAYFAHLGAGVNAHWVLSTWDLVAMRRKRLGLNATAAEEAQAAFYRLSRARVLYLPDVGDSEGHDRRRGDESDCLDEMKDLLDASGAVVAMATNCNSQQLRADPAIGGALFSRLMDGAVVVSMTGADQRKPHGQVNHG
jgi:hypothetical protein